MEYELVVDEGKEVAVVVTFFRFCKGLIALGIQNKSWLKLWWW